MSMREYATEAWGLILNKEEAAEYSKKKFMTDAKNPIDEDLEDPDYFIDNDDSLCICYEFTGEAVVIQSDGTNDYNNSTFYNGGTIYVLELNYLPNLFHKAYDSYDDLIIKLKEAYNQYLPEGFDYETHLCHLVGTVWG